MKRIGKVKRKDLKLKSTRECAGNGLTRKGRRSKVRRKREERKKWEGDKKSEDV